MVRGAELTMILGSAELDCSSLRTVAVGHAGIRLALAGRIAGCIVGLHT